jgi:hypothetical protein
MRSHPYSTPAPLPLVLHDLADELANILPNQRLSYATDPNKKTALSRASYSSDTGIELRALDPETSRLLPPPAAARRKRHHVRVQGKLAVVRSVSTVNLRAAATTGSIPPVPRYESAVGSVVGAPHRRGKGRARASVQRRSLDETARGVAQDSETDTETDEEDVEEERREVKKRDGQLRGYGIGGAGNIRESLIYCW